jgi:hypothetical protein
MEGQNGIRNRAASLTAAIFGVLAGIGGLTHGVGEVLQGNVRPESVFIPSWTQGPIAAQMGGDPGITLVPNMLVTGILAIIVSLAVIVWSAWFVGRRGGGLVLILLNVALLLVGGGVGPIVVGLLAGAAGTGVRSPYPGWAAVLNREAVQTGRKLRFLHAHPVGIRRIMAALWPWAFGVCLLDSLLLFVGAFPVVYAVDLRAYVADPSNIFLGLFFISAATLAVTVVTGVAYDIQRREQRAAIRRAA